VRAWRASRVAIQAGQDALRSIAKLGALKQAASDLLLAALWSPTSTASSPPADLGV
jgi:hypothetical protein